VKNDYGTEQEARALNGLEEQLKKTGMIGYRKRYKSHCF
jgi:hypothetical protein